MVIIIAIMIIMIKILLIIVPVLVINRPLQSGDFSTGFTTEKKYFYSCGSTFNSKVIKSSLFLAIHPHMNRNIS